MDAWHATSGIVINAGEKRPSDLQAVKVKLISQGTNSPTTLYVYPVDFSSWAGRQSLKTALNDGKLHFQRVMKDSYKGFFLDSEGNVWRNPLHSESEYLKRLRPARRKTPSDKRFGNKPFLSRNILPSNLSLRLPEQPNPFNQIPKWSKDSPMRLKFTVPPKFLNFQR